MAWEDFLNDRPTGLDGRTLGLLRPVARREVAGERVTANAAVGEERELEAEQREERKVPSPLPVSRFTPGSTAG